MSETAYTHAPAADFVLPFDLPKAGVRGRLIRLDAASGRALSSHLLPEPAARVAGEAVALSALLGSALKLDGRLTVQTKSEGPLDLVIADYYGAEAGEPETEAGDSPAGRRTRGIRGYARLNVAGFDALGEKHFAALAGKGAMAITIEPRMGGQTYQGIVELSSDGMAASAQTYFAQSEQLPTAIKLAAAPLFLAGDKAAHWRAGGMMLQVTPDAKNNEDDWERLKLILGTVEDLELVDTALKPETLLWRLFHEDEVRVHPAESIAFRCDCDTARIVQVLRSYAPQDRAGLADDDGIIRAHCEFCGKTHEVAPDALG
jgi:molecular chaperone Hsp33